MDGGLWKAIRKEKNMQINIKWKRCRRQRRWRRKRTLTYLLGAMR